jgi:hypothetical protein
VTVRLYKQKQSTVLAYMLQPTQSPSKETPGTDVHDREAGQGDRVVDDELLNRMVLVLLSKLRQCEEGVQERRATWGMG